jgi:hypothetical protein
MRIDRQASARGNEHEENVMSYALSIAERVSTPTQAAAAIRDMIATIACDLVEPSEAWKKKAQWLSGAVGTVMADLGKTENSITFAQATCDELGCGQWPRDHDAGAVYRRSTSPAYTRSSARIGNRLIRLPVALKIALASAGASVGTPISPIPCGGRALGIICTSTAGISSIRSRG